MDHPQTYLLKKIIDSDKNGLASLGHLDGKHVEDIAAVMLSFAEESVKETIELLNEGNSVTLGTLKIYPPKRKKK